MEGFSLLKYWRSSVPSGAARDANTNNKATTSAVAHNTSDEAQEDEDEDGPFFDLEFTVPEEEDDDDSDIEENRDIEQEDKEEDEEYNNEFNFTLSSSSASSSSNNDQNLSSSDDIFFNGKLVPVEPTTTTKPPIPTQFPVSLLKSATKLRVFMLGLKKPKLNSSATQIKKQETTTNEDNIKNTTSTNNKLFTVKFKVEEVPIVSLFTKKQNSPEESACNTEEKKLSREVLMHKYLKKVKPLYVRVSRKYGKDGESDIGDEKAAKCQQHKQGTLLPARLGVVRKHLGKTRSDVVAVASASQRRDDSLLQQQDGIQSAILHCKRSFNASRELDSGMLGRSVSDPCVEMSRKSGGVSESLMPL